MKKKTLILIAVALFSSIYAQTWTSVNSSVSQEITNIQFVNANKGYAVGTNSTIITTTNGGLNWSPITYTTTNHIWDLFFTSPTNGYILAGGFGTNDLYYTNNGGSTWSAPVIGGMTGQLKDMYFTSASNGWVIGTGGQLYATTNGTTWVSQNTGTTAYLTKVFFINNTHGWISVNNGNVLKTTDGGSNWTSVSTGTVPLFSINFISTNLGWAVGGTNSIAAIYTTTNGGTTWTAQNSGLTKSLYDVQFLSSTQGWAVGEDGKIIATTDGGQTWAQQSTATTQYFNCLSTDFNSQMWAVGNTGIMYKLTIPSVTDVKENRGDILLNTYPNPCNGIFNIQLEYPGTIEMIDLSGRIILAEKVNSSTHQLNLSNNQNGIYFLKATFDGKTKIVKIVKE